MENNKNYSSESLSPTNDAQSDGDMNSTNDEGSCGSDSVSESN